MPLAFTKSIQHGAPHLKIVGWDEATSKRLPGGVYQEGFLCDECEGLTSQWEGAGSTALIHRADEWKPFPDPIAPLAWTLMGADPVSLQLFFAQLLLKASLSTLPAFAAVNLGPHTPKFQEAILSKSLDPIRDAFEVVLTRYSASRKLPGVERAVQLPSRGRCGGANVYWVALNGFGAFVRVDQRSFVPSMRPVAVGNASDLIALQRSFDDNKGLGFLYRMAERVKQERERKGWR